MSLHCAVKRNYIGVLLLISSTETVNSLFLFFFSAAFPLIVSSHQVLPWSNQEFL